MPENGEISVDAVVGCEFGSWGSCRRARGRFSVDFSTISPIKVGYEKKSEKFFDRISCFAASPSLD